MKHISDNIWSIEMFSPEWWEKVNKECWYLTKDSSELDLWQGLSDFIHEWCEDNWYSIDVWNPKETKTGQSFFDDETGRYVFYRGNLFETLVARFSDYILWD